MRYYLVRKEWSQTDQESIVVIASSAQEIKDYYKALGERGPRYVSVYEVEDILTLKNGKMKSLEK